MSKKSICWRWLKNCSLKSIYYKCVTISQYSYSKEQFALRADVYETYEPQHDKTNKMSVRPAKTQISLGICPVWSESSLSARRKLGSLATHSAQAKTLIRLGGYPGWSESSLGTHSFCCFVMSWLILKSQQNGLDCVISEEKIITSVSVMRTFHRDFV